MSAAAKAGAAFRAVVRRVVVVVAGRRASHTLLILVIGAAGLCLGLALTGSAGAGTGASAVGARAETPEQSFPLAVRQASLHKLRGRIVGRATIVNTGNAPVRSTTGVLGVRRGSGGKPTGVLTFSVPSLPPRGSKGVELKTGLVSAFPVGSGTYTVLICTDVYSQIRRFGQNTNCSAGDGLSISARTLPRSSRPVPTTSVRTGLATVSRRSNAVFRFVPAVARRGFQCSLDGGPWLACRSPQRYRALVGGAHGFDVRATSVSGTNDRAQAHRSWTVDTVRPAVTLRRPLSGSTTHNTKPAFSGTAGTRPGDFSTIRVKLFRGSRASGSPLRTLVARVSGGSWSVAPTKSLAGGIYTAQAKQSDSAGNTGVSRPHAFTIGTTMPARFGGFLKIGAATAAASKTYSVGGTVSGLSGTVVLQDNGGDDLSVSRQRRLHASRPSSPAAPPTTSPSRPTRRPDLHRRQRHRHDRHRQRHQRRRHLHHQPRPTRSAAPSPACRGRVVLQDNGGDDLSVSRQRHLHVRDQARQRRRLQRHRQDQPDRADLHRRQRHRHDRLRRTSRTSPSPARQPDLLGRRDRVRACPERSCCRTTAATT